MAEKKALKGFCAARVWPVTVNNSTTYTTGLMIALLGAQGLTKDTTSNEFSVPADDGIYDSGADFQYEDLEFTVAELPLDIEAKLSGGTYNEEEQTYLFKNKDTAPEYAFGYAALQVGGQYRMFKHYVTKLMKIKVDHTTKGQNNDIASYKLTFRATQRMADGGVRFEKDSTDKTYAWLDTIDSLPVSQG